MSNNTIVSKLATLNITAEAHLEDLVKMTMKQFDKLSVISPASAFTGLLPKEGRVIVAVMEAELDAAIAANKKAPRAAASVTITSRTIYEVVAEGAVNTVTYAEWASEAKAGVVTINGQDYAIYTGAAVEFYEVGEGSDPNRPVYAVNLPVDGSEMVLTSYGITNLLRRLAAIDEVIG